MTIWDDTPLDDIDTDKLDGGFQRVMPGKYHVQVKDVEFNDKQEMVVQYEVMAGTCPGQEGKTFRDWFYPSPAARSRAFQFAVASGITTQEELEELKRQRRSFNRWKDAVGQHLKVELFEEEYNGEMKTKCGFGIWHLNNPKAKDVPINKGVLDGTAGSEENPFDDAPADEGAAEVQNPFG